MLEKEIKQIPVLILGASAVAIGMANALKEKCLLVEKTCRLASEYVDAFAGHKNKKPEDICDATKDLMLELAKRDASTEDGLYLPAISPVLFEQIKEKQIKCLFFTRVLKVKKDLKGYQVTLHNTSGITKIHTTCIIDTTVYCESKPYNYKRIESKSLNAYLVTQKEGVLPDLLQQEEVTIEKGYYKNQLVIKYKLGIEDNWVQAREKLFSYWDKREKSLEDYEIASVASEFQIKSIKQDEQIEENWFWLPSTVYEDVLEAFDQGIRTVKRMEETNAFI